MKKIELFVFVVVVIFVYISVFGPLSYQLKQTPHGTTFTFAGGYLPDYYQYLSWIKDGMMGHLMLSSRYTQQDLPRALIHPLFSASGLVGNLFQFDSPTIYLLLRLLTTGVFLGAFYWFTKRILKTPGSRIVALISFVSATGFWPDPIPWSGNFNALYKFYLPPHHLLALAMTLIILGLLSEQKLNKDKIILLISSIVLLGFLNPGSLVILLMILAIASMLPQFRKRILAIFLISVPILAYYFLIFQSTPPWSVMYERMKHFNPPTTIYDYVWALGPLGILGLGAIPFLLRNLQPTIFLLFAWAYIPLLLFPFRETIGMNASRLFQTYQYIPLSVLSVFGIETVAEIVKPAGIKRVTTKIIIAVVLLLYATIPYYVSLKTEATSLKPYWFNAYIPNDTVSAFHFLDTQTPPESVVLAGEFVSSMIPAFTHNRTLIARDDIAFDYYTKRSLVFKFFDRKMTVNEAQQFFKDYKVSYILFGIDAPTLSTQQTKSFPGLEEVFKSGQVTIVAVHK